MPKKRCLSDEQVEQEIARLLNSPYVRLAKNEEKRRYRRRQYLYTLRALEKRGMELEAAGMDFDLMEEDPAEFED